MTSSRFGRSFQRASSPARAAGILTLFALFSLGCATTATTTTATAAAKDPRFPSRDELARIRAREDPARITDPTHLEAGSWQLEGPLPDVVGDEPHAPAGPLDEILAAAIAANPDVVASKAMHCVARELARFHLETGKFPGRRLKSFLLARCGEAAFGVESQTLFADVPDTVSDEELVEDWRESLEKLAKGLARGGPSAVGIALVRQGGKAVVLAARGRRRVQVDAIPMLPAEDGTVRVRGVFLERADVARASVTQGRFGAVECTPAEGVQPPRFDFVCPVRVEDEVAWIEVGGFENGRILGTRMLDVLVRPARGPASAYTHVSYGPEVKIGEEGDAIEALAALLNRVRLEAGLPALELSRGQTEEATELAPHFFAAMVGEDEKASDVIALGMMAGWDVEAVVMSGGFAWSVVHPATDLTEVLSAALERPGARSILLSPDATRLAIGPVAEEETRSLAVLFGTYTVFDTNGAPEERAERAYERLRVLREKAGKGPPDRVAALQDLAYEAAARIEEGASPDDALKYLLGRATRKLRGTRIYAGYVGASDLEKAEFPAQLTGGDKVSLALAVAPYRKEGSPWASYIIVYAMTGEPPVQTAENDVAGAVASPGG